MATIIIIVVFGGLGVLEAFLRIRRKKERIRKELDESIDREGKSL